MAMNMIGKASIFDSIIKLCKGLGKTEVKMINNDGVLNITTVDPAHVAMLKMDLDTSAFTSFTSDVNELDIDMDKVQDFIKLIGKDTEVEFTFNEETNRITMKADGITKRFGALASAEAPSKMPQLERTPKAIITGTELMRYIKAIGDVSDFLTFDCRNKELALSGADDKGNEIKVDLTKYIQNDEDMRVHYPLVYVSELVKAMPGEITMYIRSDYPIIMETSFADENGMVTALVAPRIEQE